MTSLCNNINLLILSPHKLDLENCTAPTNTIITNLVNDNESYSPTQKEFLFRKGIYSIVNNYVNQFVSNSDLLVDRLITDITEVSIKPRDWTFDFSSLNESYSWLTKRNRSQNPKVVLKVLNFFLDRLYNDSDKEIRYLIGRIDDIQNGQKSIDIFVCTQEELKKHKNQSFFKNLVKNISSNYKMYLVDKDKLEKISSQVLDKIKYGIIIYDDCVYKDYLDNEISMGYVDCRQDTVEEYQKIYEYILENIAIEIKKEDDINEF